MATVTKTFVFTSTTEGLTDVGLSAQRGFGALADGSPASNCVGFYGVGISTTEKGRGGAGVTWETWGVPAGSTVTAAQITAWKYKHICTNEATFLSNDASQTCKMRILNASNTTVHSAGDLVSTSFGGVTTAWTAGAAGTSRAVDASYQASTTEIKLELENNSGQYTYDDDGDVQASYNLSLDTIEITVTYTAPVASFTPKTIMF